MHCGSKEIVESYFLSTIKEADALKHKGKVSFLRYRGTAIYVFTQYMFIKGNQRNERSQITLVWSSIRWFKFSLYSLNSRFIHIIIMINNNKSRSI